MSKKTTAEAEAVAQGSNIAFAPGKLDFSSTRGQALLGHEISHVASQARGEVKGSGLVNDSALEVRADREGLMVARGESVASAPLSTASAASAAGPMQAKSGKKKETKPAEDDDYGKGGIVDEMAQKWSVKRKLNRGVGGTIADYFRTLGSHWLPPGKDLKALRAMREKEEMDNLHVYNDADLVPDEIEEEETMKKMPLLPKMDEEE